MTGSNPVPWAKTLPAASPRDPICSLQGTGHARIHPPQVPDYTSCGPCPVSHNHTPPCQWESHACGRSSEDQLSGKTERRKMQTSRKLVVGPSRTSPATAHEPHLSVQMSSLRAPLRSIGTTYSKKKSSSLYKTISVKCRSQCIVLQGFPTCVRCHLLTGIMPVHAS